MLSNILKLLTFLILFSGEHATAQEIWKENFEIPGKGVWGDEDGVTIHSDFSGVTNWTLNFDNTTLTSPDDYAKTVATSGGRFECRDIDGEVVWRSSIIDISSFKQVSIQLTAYETGSGANQQNKYLKAFYKLNGGDEILFGKNGENIGNWGSNLAQQSALTGQTLQIIVYMENHYSNDKVTLDEVVVTGETADSTAPFITSVKLESATKLRVFFNEPIGEVTLANFEITHNNKAKMHIESAEKVEGQPNQVVLQISLLPFYDLQLLAQNIFDLDGNLQPGNIYPFEYLPPVASHDVIINELMPDPNPVVGLPDAEYIELFSNALYPVNIENWSLKINNVEKKLPRFILSPSGFLLLCSTSSEELLLPFGDVIAVPGFQGLRNTGALIEIFDEKGEKIDRILYSTDLFGNAEKDNGGWSLERIDPKRFCNQKQNWKASENSQGGTPGTTNSVKSANPDISIPAVVWAVAVSENQIELFFSEAMDSSFFKNTENYTLTDFGSPVDISGTSSEKIILTFQPSFQSGKNYSLHLKNLSDECGNLLIENEFIIQWNTVEPGDLVINEVLFNPFPGGNDFVEIYNNSEKYISENRLFLATRNDTLQLKQIYPFSESKNLFLPHRYLALTKDTNGVFPWFRIECPECFRQMEKFPSFKDDDDYVVLLNEKMHVIDEFFYTEKMYSPLLADDEGISLERVSFTGETNSADNWHSASTASGYGTPGYLNSQVENKNITKPEITFSPESFSPNNDGYNDRYKIQYQLEKPGYIANCWIFDAGGRFVMQLIKNEILGTSGEILWNGENETGQRQSLGVYVVIFEIIDSAGNVHRYKDGVVLTDILE